MLKANYRKMFLIPLIVLFCTFSSSLSANDVDKAANNLLSSIAEITEDRAKEHVYLGISYTIREKLCGYNKWDYDIDEDEKAPLKNLFPNTCESVKYKWSQSIHTDKVFLYSLKKDLIESSLKLVFKRDDLNTTKENLKGYFLEDLNISEQIGDLKKSLYENDIDKIHKDLNSEIDLFKKHIERGDDITVKVDSYVTALHNSLNNGLIPKVDKLAQELGLKHMSSIKDSLDGLFKDFKTKLNNCTDVSKVDKIKADISNEVISVKGKLAKNFKNNAKTLLLMSLVEDLKKTLEKNDLVKNYKDYVEFVKSKNNFSFISAKLYDLILKSHIKEEKYNEIKDDYFESKINKIETKLFDFINPKIIKTIMMLASSLDTNDKDTTINILKSFTSDIGSREIRYWERVWSFGSLIGVSFGHSSATDGEKTKIPNRTASLFIPFGIMHSYGRKGTVMFHVFDLGNYLNVSSSDDEPNWRDAIMPGISWIFARNRRYPINAGLDISYFPESSDKDAYTRASLFFSMDIPLWDIN